MPLIGFPSRFPSPCSVLLCFLAGLCLFFTLRLVVHRHSTTKTITIPGEKEKRSHTVHVERKSSSSSIWRLFAWEGLPVSLPITLTAPLNATTVGRGVGVTAGIPPVLSSPPRSSVANHARSQSEKPVSWHRCGPSFEQPVPAIYQSQEPLSMAKLIMSRHTFRRPTPKPPKRSVSVPPTPSRPQHMV